MGLEQLPPAPWPERPKRGNDQVVKSEPAQAVVNYRRIFGGMAWPEEGYPGFICVLSELPIDTSKTFDLRLPTLEITTEITMNSLAGLDVVLATLRAIRCPSLFTDLDRKYFAFVRDFNRARRESNASIHLKQTRSSSLESALLKVKDMVQEKRLKFSEVSKVRSQLTSFSKADLKDAYAHYAVRALAMVVDAFKAGDLQAVVTEVPRLSSWY